MALSMLLPRQLGLLGSKMTRWGRSLGALSKAKVGACRLHVYICVAAVKCLSAFGGASSLQQRAEEVLADVPVFAVTVGKSGFRSSGQGGGEPEANGDHSL